METPTLHAQMRTILGKQVKKLREIGKLPIVLYGHDTDTKSLTVDAQEFSRIFRQAGASTLVNLVIDDSKPIKVLLHEPQLEPIKGTALHADLYQVKMTEKIRTEIPLHFIGVAPAVDELEGNLITNRDNLEVECLPDALVSAIEVDISTLKTFDDIVHVKDITVPSGMEVLVDPEETIILVTPPRSEEELEEELQEETAESEQAAIDELAEKPAEEADKEKSEE